MRHFTAPAFWVAYRRLRPEIRRLAKHSYNRLASDPGHPSLRFKRVGKYWCARVGMEHRALALKDQDDFIWFWIGPHDEYDRLIK